MKKRSIHSKMLATYLTVTLFILALLGATASAVFVNHYLTERKTELVREGSEIISVISDKYMADEKRNAALDEMITIARKYDALIQIHFFDAHNGNVTVSNYSQAEDKWSKMAEYFSYMDDIEIDSETNTATVNDVFAELSDMRTMTLSMNIENEDQKVGILCFTLDVTDTYDVISSVLVDVLIFSAIATILAFIVVLYITERITRPIAEMTKTVRSFSKGEYDAKIKNITDDEIGELAGSFNKMADEMNMLEESRRSFVANVSHELRSPLASMRGFLVAMQDGTIPPEQYGKYLAVVIDENNRMTEIVNELLNMARIDSGGEAALSIEAFDMAEVVRTTALTFEARANEKKLDLIISFSEEHIYVSADKGQIIHVLRNLIDNAIKFTPNGGTINIIVTAQKQIVKVIVKDSGNGIPEDEMPRIFDRFYKAEKAHTRSAGSGTGLGLSIAKKIMEAHGQELTVCNENGAKFTFTLKRAVKPKRNSAGASAYRPSMEGMEKKRSYKAVHSDSLMQTHSHNGLHNKSAHSTEPIIAQPAEEVTTEGRKEYKRINEAVHRPNSHIKSEVINNAAHNLIDEQDDDYKAVNKETVITEEISDNKTVDENVSEVRNSDRAYEDGELPAPIMEEVSVRDRAANTEAEAAKNRFETAEKATEEMTEVKDNKTEEG